MWAVKMLSRAINPLTIRGARVLLLTTLKGARLRKCLFIDLELYTVQRGVVNGEMWVRNRDEKDQSEKCEIECSKRENEPSTA